MWRDGWSDLNRCLRVIRHMRTRLSGERRIVDCLVDLKRTVMFVVLFVALFAPHLTAQPCAHPATWNTTDAR